MTDVSQTADSSRSNLAFGLGLAALASWIIAMAATGEDGDDNSWLWIVMFGFGAAALIAGLRVNAPRGRAWVGVVVGGLLVALFLAFIIGDLVT